MSSGTVSFEPKDLKTAEKIIANIKEQKKNKVK